MLPSFLRRPGRESHVPLALYSRAHRVAVSLSLLYTIWLHCGEAQALENRHALGIGYQSGHVAGDEARKFHFRSLPLAYLGRFGGEWGAELRVATLFPLRARQEEFKISPRAEYDRVQMYDALFAPSYRFNQIENWSLETGLGPHFHYTRFRSAEYVEWSSAALGLGASATGRTYITQEIRGARGEVGARCDLSYDFVDLSRGGHMNGAVQAQLLVFVGIALGGSR